VGIEPAEPYFERSEKRRAASKSTYIAENF